ncbi:2OG-Fe(II) oxygenase [Arcobacter sp. F2176]|uniref:2OG-Fe(II) oxygenase n=1 Tax=Arcobacter sp. F2176 TaxID=2044511 RepID=UPI00100BC1E9|nr:2OG-Fe(II) oxygenase [Arcobacter sp. F2176]RXJ79796.1 hypothetical protein CRU95_13250 [Arcobacter sp. F2176]
MTAPFDIKQLELTQFGNNIFSPKQWLDTIVPESMKILPNPYHEAPFIYENINFDFSDMKSFIKNHEDESKKIGIISTDDGVVLPKKNIDIRNTYNIIPNDTFLKEYNIFFESQKSKIEEFFNVSLMQSIDPQILIYKNGCFYKRHSDNCSEIVDLNKNIIEYKPVAPARIITTVLFITTQVKDPKDEFEFSGGELVFDFLYDDKFRKISIKPKEGDFVAFLSNPYFSHSVKKIKDGMRVSVVQWHNAIVH